MTDLDRGPLVTCIVPVFNGERFLEQALDSIRTQTYPAFEILVIDDGSTDGTAAVLAGQGEQVRWIGQPHRGQAAARNAGVRAAGGEFVAFLDADDVWESEKIAMQMARLQDADVDLCFTRFQNFWMPELEEHARRHQAGQIARPSAAWSICTLVAHRSVFDRFGPFDETLLWPNMPWFLEAARRRARIEVLPHVLMRRRLHHGNATRAEFDRTCEPMFPILKAWRDYQRRAGDA